MENAFEDAYVAVWIRDRNVSDSDGQNAATNAANIQSVFELVVVSEDELVVVHMMCCPAVLDPYAVYLSNTYVDGCFAAIRESTKNRVVRGGDGAVISISQISGL